MPRLIRRLAANVTASALAPLLVVSAAALATLSTPLHAQHQHTGAFDYDDPGDGGSDPQGSCESSDVRVSVNGLSFNPATVTVSSGTTVCWSWSTGSTPHTVTANDNSFNSGNPQGSGTYRRTFNDPGNRPYHCQVHGNSMSGTVVVQQSDGGGGNGGGGDGGGSGPGTLAIAAALSVDENASLTVTVERTGGTTGKATVAYALVGGSAKQGKDYLPKKGTLTLNDGQSSATFEVSMKNDTTVEPDETFSIKLSKATGASLGNSTAVVTIHDDDGCPSGVATPAGLRASAVSNDEIELAWAGDARATGYRIERRGTAGEFVEVAALSGAATAWRDSGLAAGSTWFYRVRAESPEGLSEPSAVAVAATAGGLLGGCRDGAGSRCLQGRFLVTVQATGGEGGPSRRVQTAAMATSDVGSARTTGLFALTSGADPQVMVTLRDRCAENGHFAVDLAATTDAELLVRVRDARTGRSWLYFNPAGSAPAPVADRDAFLCR